MVLQTLLPNAAIASSSGITHAEVNDAISKAFDDNRAIAIWGNGSPTEHTREEEKKVIVNLKNKLRDLAEGNNDFGIGRTAFATAHELLDEIDIVSIKSEDDLPGFLFKYQGLQQYAHAGAGLKDKHDSTDALTRVIYVDRLLLDILAGKGDMPLFETAFSAMLGHELYHILVQRRGRPIETKEADASRVEAEAEKFEAIFDPDRLLRKIIAEIEDSILDQTIYGIEFSTVHGERRTESAAKSILGTPLKNELKDVYRILARKYHPDVSKGDERQTIRFKFVNAAYELLQGNIDWSEFNKRIRGEKEKLRELNSLAMDSIISVEEMEKAYTDEREFAFSNERDQDVAITLMRTNTIVDRAVRMPRASSHMELREAIKTYSNIFHRLNLSQKKAYTSSWHFFSLALREIGRYDDAITLGTQFMEDDYDIYSGLIDAYAHKGNLNKAEELLHNFPKIKELGRFILAMQYYRDSYRAAIVDAYYFIGRGYAKKDDMTAARYFGKARDMSYEYFNLSYKPAILAQYQAIRRCKDRRTEKADKSGWLPEYQLKDELQKAVKLIADGYRRWTRRQFCPVRARIGAEVSEIFRQIPLTQIDHSRYAIYHLKWGIAEIWQKRYEKAIEVFRRFLLSSPDFYNCLIFALALKGETGRAEKLLEEDPLRAMKDKIDGYYFLGLAYLLEGEQHKAYEHLHLAYQNTKDSHYFNGNTGVNNENIETAYLMANALVFAAENQSADSEEYLKTAVQAYYRKADYDKAWILFREEGNRSNHAAQRLCEIIHKFIITNSGGSDAKHDKYVTASENTPKFASRIVCLGITDNVDELYAFETSGIDEGEQSNQSDGLFTAKSSLRSNRLHDALRFFQHQRSRIVREFGLNIEAAKKRRIYYDVHFGIQLTEAMLELRSRSTEGSRRLRKMLKEAGEQYFAVQDYKAAADLCAEVGKNGIPKARQIVKLIGNLLDVGFLPLLDKLEGDISPGGSGYYYKYLKTDDGVKFLIVFDSKGQAKKFLSSGDLSPVHIRDALIFITTSTKSNDDRLTLIEDLARENDLEKAIDEDSNIDAELREMIESFHTFHR